MTSSKLSPFVYYKWTFQQFNYKRLFIADMCIHLTNSQTQNKRKDIDQVQTLMAFDSLFYMNTTLSD